MLGLPTARHLKNNTREEFKAWDIFKAIIREATQTVDQINSRHHHRIKAEMMKD